MADWEWQLPITGKNPSDDAEIERRLMAGDIAGLEEVAEILDGFPNCKDGLPSGRYWVRTAVDVGTISAIEWMIAKGADLNLEDGEGGTPLHSCIDRAKADRHAVLSMLIKAGADVNIRGFNNWTPLHLAAIRDDKAAMQILMDAGADRTRRTVIDNYATPAEEARILGHNDSADFIDWYKKG
ncbi:ankyrin repeat domain-containing protein [Sulfitobacter pacificus]|uniref:Ankyrin repeat domain-containing protein n=1 Tax=Sulfitobacter pacificus TaxID=1499314 RepID=A0ABQ5VL67_9RHOB|nr:ankyrin repeat domain-containing protein [Sulfitobacter pacificus]GLQ27877.1 hypothetical protein GCM10007927_26800 [Sulfitobacter pacificus]